MGSVALSEEEDRETGEGEKVRRQTSEGREESPHLEPNWPAPWPWTCGTGRSVWVKPPARTGNQHQGRCFRPKKLSDQKRTGDHDAVFWRRILSCQESEGLVRPASSLQCSGTSIPCSGGPRRSPQVLPKSRAGETDRRSQSNKGVRAPDHAALGRPHRSPGVCLRRAAVGTPFKVSHRTLGTRWGPLSWL